jgi:internalin A
MTHNFISYAQFRQVCAEHGETSQADQDSLAQLFHCLGLALNYRNDSRLRDTHILNPFWITEGIYRILNSRITAEKHGEISVGDLEEILPPIEYPPSMHYFLLALMQKFELCFRFPEPRDEIFLVPQLLGKEQPELPMPFERTKCLNFAFVYPVWPEGLVPRFIVRTHALSSGLPRWRTGVVLRFEGNSALVEADPNERTVFVSVTGPSGRRQLLSVIRSDFERIHADFPKLNPIAMVPLEDDPGVFIPYDELCAFERAKVEWIHRVVRGTVKRLDVKKLLASVEAPADAATPAVKVFVSYSHKDDHFRSQLATHLKLLQRRGMVSMWSDRMISPSDDWQEEINSNLERADLIIFLVSAYFIASNYCYEIEVKRAMEKHDSGESRVVPIIVRDCQWKDTPFGKLQALPTDAKPVQIWSNRDKAWRDIADGIQSIIEKILAKRATGSC